MTNIDITRVFDDSFKVDLSEYANRIKNKTLVLTLSRNDPNLHNYEEYLNVKNNKTYWK